MAKSVELRAATVALRSFQLTRSLIKQAKRLRAIPKEFRESESAAEVNDKCVGWVRGSAIGEDEFTNYLLFVHDGDLYIYAWPGYKGIAKQIYI